jgi:diketogulonate reductase-like aldo/keto reductase
MTSAGSTQALHRAGARSSRGRSMTVDVASYYPDDRDEDEGVHVDHGIADTDAVLRTLKSKSANEKDLTASIGKSHCANSEQIALAFLMAKGLIVIPSSAKKDRIASNFEAPKITLTPSGLKARKRECIS